MAKTKKTKIDPDKLDKKKSSRIKKSKEEKKKRNFSVGHPIDPDEFRG